MTAELREYLKRQIDQRRREALSSDSSWRYKNLLPKPPQMDGHCPQGHPHDQYRRIRANGYPWCSACKKLASQRTYAKQKASRG